MTVVAPPSNTPPRDCIVEALARRSWPIHVLFLAWGWLAADQSKSEAVRGPWARDPFEGLVCVVEANGFTSTDQLRAAIADEDRDAALTLAASAFASTPHSEIDAALRRHPAAIDLAYGHPLEASSQRH